ncbi:MAG: hypothetical protein H8F28_18000, partial [Fibrella sp.]|nr:hypothetical protein [Armatimonadota bacterium]
MGAFRIRQTCQGEREPVCTHCGSKTLQRKGVRDDRQYYRCKTCQRGSFGLPPDLRPKCPNCKKTPHATLLSDGRFRYGCPHCNRAWMSEYKIGRKEKSKERFQHLHTFYLNRSARNGLFEYVQAARCTDAQALRAIFRHVLTGKVFWTMRGSSPRSRLLYRIERDPGAAATRFP